MRGKTVKRILLWSAVALAVLAATYCVLRFGFDMDVLDQSGWNTKDGAVRYLDYWGRPQTGWQDIEGAQYYFLAEDGAMVTGWTEVDGALYYFREDGTKATGWLEEENGRYYLGQDGVLHTGWLQLDEANYYLLPEDGRMVTGWFALDEHQMYFSQEGVLQTGWQTLEGKRFYFTPEGYTVSGWVELEGVRYQFAEDGSIVVGWFEDDSGKYYFDEDGRPHTGWLDWEQKRYYLKADGSVTTGWLELEQDRYYFLPTGRMAIGEVEVDGVSRFFTSTGKEVLFCNPWYAIPADFQLDLVDIQGYKIDSAAKEPLQQMIDAAKEDGVHIGINNTYRSHATQLAMWNNRIQQRMEAGMTKAEAEAKTGESLAIPGHSEHETGLALDVNNGLNVYKWLGENCWDYGFILRYPDDRMNIIGIIYEPWHFRYVGTELSLELKELGLCMEEYFDMLTEQQKAIAD